MGRSERHASRQPVTISNLNRQPQAQGQRAPAQPHAQPARHGMFHSNSLRYTSSVNIRS